MLAIIDGLRTKLTALNNTVQGLVNKPSGAVPYSKVGDMWVGLGVVPQVFFSETWDGGKSLTIPPLANGWWIDYKDKANAE